MTHTDEPWPREADNPPTEQSPLLADAESQSPPRSPTPSSPSVMRSREARNASAVVTLLCVATFVAASAAGFTLMPLTRIVEDVLCRAYYDNSEEPIAEKLCKVDTIQSE